MGTAVGVRLGVAVGASVGARDGCAVGFAVGEAEGSRVGFAVGRRVGDRVGRTDGAGLQPATNISRAAARHFANHLHRNAHTDRRAAWSRPGDMRKHGRCVQVRGDACVCRWRMRALHCKDM